MAERKQAEAKLTEQLGRLNLLHQITRAIANARIWQHLQVSSAASKKICPSISVASPVSRPDRQGAQNHPGWRKNARPQWNWHGGAGDWIPV